MASCLRLLHRRLPGHYSKSGDVVSPSSKRLPAALWVQTFEVFGNLEGLARVESCAELGSGLVRMGVVVPTVLPRHLPFPCQPLRLALIVETTRGRSVSFPFAPPLYWPKLAEPRNEVEGRSGVGGAGLAGRLWGCERSDRLASLQDATRSVGKNLAFGAGDSSSQSALLRMTCGGSRAPTRGAPTSPRPAGTHGALTSAR